MPLNLIGLIQASRVNAAPGQGFKNYVVQAGTGVAMSDYLFGTPLSYQSISGVGQTAGTMTQTSTTYNPGATGGSIPAFTNVTVVASYNAGSKLPAIYDPNYVAGDLANQILVENVFTDGGSVQPGFEYVTRRSVTVDTVNKTVTAVLTFNNNNSYVGTLPQAGSGGYKTINFRLGIRPEPHFNLRAYTGVPGSASGHVGVYVRPYRDGQPTPTFFPQIIAPVPSDSGSWVGDGSNISAQKGDYLYYAQTPGSPQSNYFLYGYRLRPSLAGTWFSDFTTDYGVYGLQMRYRWFRKIGTEWVLQAEFTESQAVQTPSTPLNVTWSYPDQVNPSPAAIELRFTAQVISPFNSPTPTTGVAQLEYTVTPPTLTLVGPGGGPVQ